MEPKILNIPMIKNNFDLSNKNTMALSCIAERAVVLDNEQQILELFSRLHDSQKTEPSTPLLILSGGSNVILPKQYKGLAILPRYTGMTVIQQTDDFVEIEVMAGNNWHQLVVECTEKGWYGLENLALIPGLVGAAPVQNIGAYGVQLEDCFVGLKAFHIPTQSWQFLSKNDCKFAYRDSVFKQNSNKWLISRVCFKLHKDSSIINANYGDVQAKADELARKQGRMMIEPVDVMNAIIHIRQSKLPDPTELANTGSFFQNPIITRSQYLELVVENPDLPKYDIDDNYVKVPAGWLIDQAGLKGKGIAPILTHTKQALVITNHAPHTATQDDIANTRDLIIQTVVNKYGIVLNPEPVWIE